MYKLSNLKKNYIFNVLVVVIESIITLLLTPIMARVLESSGTGIYSYTYSLITMFTLIGALGTSTHAQRKIAMNLDNKDEYSKIFWEIFILRSIFVMISFLIFLLTILLLNKYIMFFIIQIPYFLSAIIDISWLYEGLEKFKGLALKNLIFKIIGATLVLLLVHNKDDLWIYLLVLSLSSLLGQVVLWLNIGKYVNKIKISKLNLKRHFKDILMYFVPTIAYQFYSLIDKVLLGLLSSEEETGYYEKAQQIVAFCATLFNAYNVVIRSRISYLFMKKDQKEIDDKITKSLSFVFGLSLPIALGIIGIANNFVPWYLGEGYIKVATLLMILAPVVIIMALRMCIGSIIYTPFGLQSKSNVAEVIAAVFNCVLTAILIPLLDSIGASIASICAELLVLILFVIYAQKHHYLNLKEILKNIYKYVISALIMFVAVYFIGKLMDGIVATVIQIIGGAIIYFLLLLILKDKIFYETIKSLFFTKKEGVINEQ